MNQNRFRFAQMPSCPHFPAISRSACCLFSILLSISGLFAAGCASISTFQSGKTVPKGDLTFGIGLGGGKFTIQSDLPDFKVTLPAFNLEAWLRYGLLDFMDIGAKYALPGYGLLDTRFAVLKEEKKAPLSAALGLGLGASTLEVLRTSNNETVEDRTRLLDLIGTLYVSRDITRIFTVYASPRIVWRKLVNERDRNNAPQIEEIRNRTLAGGGFGVMLGTNDDGHFMLEYAEAVDVNDSSHRQRYFGFGADVRFKDLF